MVSVSFITIFVSLLSHMFPFIQDYFFSIPKGFSRRIFEAPKASSNALYGSGSPGSLDSREKSLSSAQDPRERKSRPFAIIPGVARHTFVYEPSISSKSDLNSLLDQPQRPERDPETGSVLSFTIDHSPALASSSLETLQSTLLSPPPTVLDVSDSGSPPHPDNHLASLIEAHMGGSVPIGIPLPDGRPLIARPLAL